MSGPVLRAALAVAALFAVSPAAWAQPPAQVPTEGMSGALHRQAAPKTSAEHYIRASGVYDLFQIDAGRLALKRSHDQRLRRFAERTVADHKDALAALRKAVAQAHRAPPPRELDASHLKLMHRLEAAKDPKKFDLLYADISVRSHSLQLALEKEYARGGQVPSLTALARERMPHERDQMQAARAMASAATRS